MQSLYPNKIKHLFSVLNCTVSKFLKLRRKKKKVKELSNEERWSCVLGAESMLDITGLSTEDRVWTGRCLGIWSGLSGRCWQKGSGVANSRRRERKEERKERAESLKGPRPSTLRAGTPSRVYRAPFCLVFLPPRVLSRALSTGSLAFRVRIFILWRRSWIWESSRKIEWILIRRTLFLRLGNVAENQVMLFLYFVSFSFLIF